MKKPVILLMLSLLCLQSCGTLIREPEDRGFRYHNSIDLPKENRGSVRYLVLAVNLFLTYGVGIIVDLMTGRFYNAISGDVVDKNITAEQIKDSQYAYIMVDSYNQTKINTKTEWLNTKKRYNDHNVLPQETVVFDPKVPPRIIRLTPGRYTLINYNVSEKSDDGKWYRYLFYLWDQDRNQNEKTKHNIPLIAYFEVEPGKIYYLGNITFAGYVSTINENKVLFLIEDRYAMDATEIAKEYKNFKSFEKLVITNFIKISPQYCLEDCRIVKKYSMGLN